MGIKPERMRYSSMEPADGGQSIVSDDHDVLRRVSREFSRAQDGADTVQIVDFGLSGHELEDNGPKLADADRSDLNQQTDVKGDNLPEPVKHDENALLRADDLNNLREPAAADGNDPSKHALKEMKALMGTMQAIISQDKRQAEEDTCRTKDEEVLANTRNEVATTWDELTALMSLTEGSIMLALRTLFDGCLLDLGWNGEEPRDAFMDRSSALPRGPTRPATTMVTAIFNYQGPREIAEVMEERFKYIFHCPPKDYHLNGSSGPPAKWTERVLEGVHLCVYNISTRNDGLTNETVDRSKAEIFTLPGSMPLLCSSCTDKPLCVILDGTNTLDRLCGLVRLAAAALQQSKMTGLG
ncbi:hypothetical protein FN846DRAFT_911820 [Sphaerosporella brunnea]|uniref:Uncharacterized protein n=1 Tax=Sphaerosporella brunnea TaxID=1250544 RepID=A0A5J5EJL4_9PEZI|nr:hypothetical protein FN846DRAFT_911820 [Sphaerosporella brunnea]